METARKWATGDLFNARRLGDGREACERVGINYDTARNYASVCKAFKLSFRNYNLSFEYHRTAMAAQPEDRQRWVVYKD
jgi:hypothetical protein